MVLNILPLMDSLTKEQRRRLPQRPPGTSSDFGNLVDSVAVLLNNLIYVVIFIYGQLWYSVCHEPAIYSLLKTVPEG